MRTLIGLILMLAGGAVILYALYIGFSELTGLYQGALNDPLGQPADNEKATADRMMKAVYIGAIGVPPFLIGTVMLKFRRRRKR